MIAITVKGYSRPCGGVVGGLARLWVGDPKDFAFTQPAAAANGDAQAYSVIALSTAAAAAISGSPSLVAALYPIVFLEEEGEYTFQRSSKGCSTKYQHNINAQLPQLSQGCNTFLQKMDAAGCCTGLLFVMEMNDGKIFVAGESIVNGVTILPFRMKHGDTDGTSGKVLDDYSGVNVKFTGAYTRPLYEFSGGAAAIEAMEP